MVLKDRRHPNNVHLREKIDHIQQTSEQLKSLVDDIQAQAVAWARQGKVTDLPDTELAQELERVFELQRRAMAHIHRDIKGVMPPDVGGTIAMLISEEELAALLK